MAYLGKSPSQGVRYRYYFTATGGETSLSGADDNANTLVFTDGAYVDVALNGVTLVAGTDYNTSTANTISGLSALAASDIVEIVVYDVFNLFGGTITGTLDVSGALTFAGGTTSADLNFGDNDKAQFGASNDLRVYHDATGVDGVNGAGSYIEENGAGNLWIMGSQFVSIEKADGTNRVLQADTTNGDIELKYQDATRLTTTSAGIDVTGNLTVDTDTLYVDATTNNVCVGDTNTSLFNGVGGSMKVVVIGDDSATTITNNSDAGIAIVNTNQTAGNLAGLHFARADTDDSPNYAGASIVAQFPDAQVTGQYPKGEIAFLTSTAANYAPSEKMRIAANGDVTISGGVTADTVTLDNGANDWQFSVDGSNNLIISYGGTSKAKLDSSGNLTVVGDVTAFGTI